jgi:NAD(P)-dependent dehydrogenase (short-subunit alcohol dehydrogenase family)
MDSIGRYFAVALVRHGITVKPVSPGMSYAGCGTTPQEFQDAVKGWVESRWTPIRRGKAADIADVCALRCSYEARFVTGHGISVDGGSSLTNPDFPLSVQLPA